MADFDPGPDWELTPTNLYPIKYPYIAYHKSANEFVQIYAPKRQLPTKPWAVIEVTKGPNGAIGTWVLNSSATTWFQLALSAAAYVDVAKEKFLDWEVIRDGVE